MNPTTVTTPNELEIRVERIFDAPRAHVFSVWTDPKLIPEWWGDGTVVEEMDVRPGGTYRFRTAFGVVEGEFREVDAPERLVQTFQNHLQTLEFEGLGDSTKLTQTMRFATTEERDTTMQYGIEELGDWRGETLARLRRLVKQADPDVVEEWKWRGVPVWSHAGIICTGETYKNVVKMTFAKGASLQDPLGLFNSSLDGNTRRAIDFHEGDKIDEKALKALIRAAVALNTSVRATARPVRSEKRPKSARGAS